ncbi:MAG TPA: porin, partial [Telmatospirillum sp.]|nr:porin [Telmatospirillum sp.]
MKIFLFRAALLSSVAMTALWVTPVRADDIGQLKAELEQLKAQNKALNARIDQIQATVETSASAKPDVAQSSGSHLTFDRTASASLEAVMGPADTQGKVQSDGGVPVLQIYNDSDARVGIYGIVDATISSKTNGNPKHTWQTGFDAGWYTGSRWGMTGSKKLGEGTDAIFKLEGGIDTFSGNLNTANVLFDRDAWLG